MQLADDRRRTLLILLLIKIAEHRLRQLQFDHSARIDPVLVNDRFDLVEIALLRHVQPRLIDADRHHLFARRQTLFLQFERLLEQLIIYRQHKAVLLELRNEFPRLHESHLRTDPSNERLRSDDPPRPYVILRLIVRMKFSRRQRFFHRRLDLVLQRQILLHRLVEEHHIRRRRLMTRRVRSLHRQTHARIVRFELADARPHVQPDFGRVRRFDVTVARYRIAHQRHDLRLARRMTDANQMPRVDARRRV